MAQRIADHGKEYNGKTLIVLSMEIMGVGGQVTRSPLDHCENFGSDFYHFSVLSGGVPLSELCL